ncbi:unnamed protein product [Diamesa serratosioi]
MILLTRAILVFIAFCGINCLNISPNPNIIINNPVNNQNKTSYFGYAVNLRKNSVLIGAPKATTNPKFNETGEVFKCEITDFKDSNCYPYKLHANTNEKSSGNYFKSENNEYQMLGAAMDGYGSDKDKFIVCAPNLKNVLHGDYYLNGGCFMVSNSETSETSNVTNILVTKKRDDQLYLFNKTNYVFHKLAQQGFSVHIIENSSEIIMGTPGSLVSAGSFIRYNGVDKSVIRHPIHYPHGSYSYLGYAVTSAKFNKPNDDDTYYVASAPRMTNKNVVGEVIIYNISNGIFHSKKSFLGFQNGDYFGYSLLVEDFNNDGLPDLVVSAPLYSTDKSHENGAVYIYLNAGKMNLVIQPQIKSDFKFSGRFGTALSNVGDLNMDGYNDIAISAPFEGNGAVYIYLGGPEGLSSTHSQKIVAPVDFIPVPVLSMFGHSISRGVDIDDNGYNDIAIGSPNSEKVYVYRSYPVVKIISSIDPSQREIFTNATSLNITACAHHNSVIKSNIDFNMTIILDSKYNRTSFKSGKNQQTEKVKLNAIKQCFNYTITMKKKLTEVYEPLELMMNIQILNNIPTTGNDFCDNCVTFDSKETATASNKVAFITGCRESRCKSNLTLVGSLINVEQPYIMGTTKTISIEYDITNTGENAYLTQLMILIPTNVTQFTKILPNCKLSNHNSLLTCSIMDGRPILKDNTRKLSITLEMSRIQGSSLKINASVTCAGMNLNEKYNSIENEIKLKQFSVIDMTSISSDSDISLDDILGIKEINYNYRIVNSGPSNVNVMRIVIPVPIKYLAKPNNDLEIIDLSKSSISWEYDNNKLEVQMLDRKTNETAVYYTDETLDQNVLNLKTNETIYLDCSNPSETTCINVQINVHNFKSGNEPLDINIKLELNLDNIDQIFDLKKDFQAFLYKINAKIQRIGDETMKISIRNPSTIITPSHYIKYLILIIVVSIICGILLFVLVAFILYKLGFFKRKKKEEIKQYRRESRRITMRIQEAALLSQAIEEDALENDVSNNSSDLVKQLQANQKFKNIPNEDNVHQRGTSKARAPELRASYRVVQSITLKENEA